jgi:hypothetical protein
MWGPGGGAADDRHRVAPTMSLPDSRLGELLQAADQVGASATAASGGSTALAAGRGWGVPGSLCCAACCARCARQQARRRAARPRHKYASAFDRPLCLGVAKRLAVVTCMDSRLHVEEMLGLGLGDAEIIRNAGGRVWVGWGGVGWGGSWGTGIRQVRLPSG